jgi:SAM-dependent methyltransferase
MPREFLSDAAELSLIYPHFRELLGDPIISRAIESDPLPIPHPEDREGYEPNCHLNYWLSGLADLRDIQSSVPASAFAQVLDFGGASGRLARHLATAPGVERVTVADLNRNHVAWVNDHFPPNVRALKVSPQPHFPLADNSVTLCVGLSVFTHIDVWETGWLAEIHRVLVEGGMAYVTIHSERSWEQLRQRELSGPENTRFAELAGAAAMPPRVVLDCKPGTRYHCCNTFHSTAYIRRVWGRWFDVTRTNDKPNHFHSVVVLRKSNSGSA